MSNRAHAFGEIVNGEIKLTPLGQSAQDCWPEIPAHFPFVELGGFVVMPNHVHGVVIINKTDNPASIIRGYKIGVTKIARKNNILFEWQPRYHDHVIRNAQEGERIDQYILTNPQHWQADTFYLALP